MGKKKEALQLLHCLRNIWEETCRLRRASNQPQFEWLWESVCEMRLRHLAIYISNLRDGARGVGDFGQYFIAIFIETRKNIACRKGRGYQGKSSSTTEVPPRTESTTKSEDNVFHLLHFCIVSIIAFRVEFHRFWVYFRVMEHLPGEIWLLELENIWKQLTTCLALSRYPLGWSILRIHHLAWVHGVHLVSQIG